MAFSKDQLVLQGMLEAGELGHPNHVAVGFQNEAPDHISDLRTEFTPLDRMAPKLAQRTVPTFKQLGNFRLTTGNEGDRLRFVAQSKADGVIGRRVARMQRGDHVGTAARKYRLCNRGSDE